ncbi:SDR family oxidoreductase [Microbacterium trichothecenolyticum]|uniref:SDR family oxidoreductase n=1 Tax=Microbacterium ureisolvens TaxID=2781186 RepID=A0ABS7I0Y6_9MICO|nr:MULTISPECIES: SDR family NAD(P)-dependent oxidoreductase [Microbacterium]MBW9110430.1 SDR family oxidoreductase [Microbacterium ureisolvens]MBW9120535.1 SDR family oxidoreductase [Microbacterium trichothecenolyticum]
MSKRTALVTGAASGIGAACVERFRNDGIEVVTLDRDPGCDFTVDISDPAAVATVADQLAGVDILVNSAGIVGPSGELYTLTVEDWQRTFDVNVLGMFLVSRAVIPAMVKKGWGRIVNISSVAGKDGNPRQSAYSASKAAQLAMTKSMGKELATTGVLVNAIAPASIQTAMTDAVSPEVIERLKGLIPMGRIGQATEAAALVAWLASDECSFSTGAIYDLTGGRATY